MKVIKHGKRANDKKPYKIKCDECGCVFEALRTEFSHQDDPRDGDYFYISCPECSRTNTIATSLFESGRRNFLK